MSFPGVESAFDAAMTLMISSFLDKTPEDFDRIPGRAELMELYKDFCKNYPVITIEDPFDQDDWENTTAFTAEGVSQVHAVAPE